MTNIDYNEAFLLLCDDLNVVIRKLHRTIETASTTYEILTKFDFDIIGSFQISDEEMIACNRHYKHIWCIKLREYYRNNKDLFVDVYESSSLL